MHDRVLLVSVLLLAAAAITCSAEVKVLAEHLVPESAGSRFAFKNIPPPSANDAAGKAKLTIVDGRRDANGGELEKLQDGRLPADEDDPSANFFFRAGSEGGRLLVDLNGVIEIKQVNTYSWHSNTRAPQVYRLYASEGAADGFNPEPKAGTDPTSCGWALVANVDTRPRQGDGGGQHGVCISDSGGSLGRYRYLLFDVSRTETRDAFGNTFYSEIDVVDPNTPPVAVAPPAPPPPPISVVAGDGKYHISIDLEGAPDLGEWAGKTMAPVIQEWYPKLIKLLPSEGYQAPTNLIVRFRDNMGGTPASASRGRINCNAGWFRRNLKGEALGSVVHEMVHVVQQYGRVDRSDAQAVRTPGWVVEGIADYIRWFIFEPQSKGAEITQRNLSRARYDASYRVTANFLNWATGKYAPDLVQKLNAAARAGRYNDALWKEWTGKTAQELGEEWRKAHEDRLAAAGQ